MKLNAWQTRIASGTKYATHYLLITIARKKLMIASTRQNNKKMENNIFHMNKGNKSNCNQLQKTLFIVHLRVTGKTDKLAKPESIVNSKEINA